jgi:hypothetical protein
MDFKKAVLCLTLLLLWIFPLAASANLATQVFVPVVQNQAPEPSPTSPPPPGGAHVLDNFTYFEDESGELHIFGEVQNNTGLHLEIVEVTVDLLDSQGSITGSEFTYVWINNLPAGDKSCFHLSYPNPPPWAVFEFRELEYYSGGRPLPRMLVYDDHGSYDPLDHYYTITGMVLNDNGTRLEWVDIYGTLYNRENKVIGCDFNYINNDHLDPNQVSAFELFFDIGELSSVASYRLQVDGSED